MKAKKVLIILVLLFAALQLVPVERTNPPVKSDLKASIEVNNILKNSCYDCHSNETKWPWYSYVAPVSFFLADHVEHGRKHLNFSEWGSLDSAKQKKKLHEIVEEIEEGEMPLSSYLLLHSNAKLTESDIKIIKEWAENYKYGNQN